MLLGERIKSLRNQRGEKLKDVAKSIDISVSYLSDLERNRTRPSLQTLEDLASHFELTVNELLVGVQFAGEIDRERALPPELIELINDDEYGDEITEEWIELLTKIELRGKRPKTKRDWMTLYLNLRQILGESNK